MFAKIRVKKLKDIFCKLPQLLGENAFLSFLALLLLALLLSSAVFYRYVFTIKDIEIQGVISTTNFRNDVFQEVLDTWKVRAERFEAAASQDYRNILQSRAVIQEELPAAP